MAASNTLRVQGRPVEEVTHRVMPSDRRAWTFRAGTFAARSFIAPLLAVPAIGGAHTVRVTDAHIEQEIDS